MAAKFSLLRRQDSPRACYQVLSLKRNIVSEEQRIYDFNEHKTSRSSNSSGRCGCEVDSSGLVKLGLMVLCATQLECECHCPQDSDRVLRSFRCILSMGVQLECGWWDAHPERVPYTCVRAAPMGGNFRSSGRRFQPGSPPLPLTQLSMQGSDLSFFPLSQGVGFHFLHSPGLCLRWTQLRAHLRGEGTGGTRGTPRSQHRSPAKD